MHICIYIDLYIYAYIYVYICTYIYSVHRTSLAPPLPGVIVRVTGDPPSLFTPDCLIDFTDGL